METIGKSSNDDRRAIVNQLLKDKTPITKLLDILLSSTPICTRFSWLIGDLSEQDSSYTAEIIPFILENKTEIQVPDINRVLAKQCYLSTPHFPEKLEGQLIDTLFHYLSDTRETISTKDYSMKALEKVVAKYPDLKSEFLLVLNSLIESHSGGLQKRAEKIKSKIAK